MNGRFIIENGTVIGYDNGGEKIVERMEVPEGVISIGDSAFSKLEKIKTLILPKSLRQIRLLGYYDKTQFDAVIFQDPKSWILVGYTDWAGQRMEERISESEMADPEKCCRYLRVKGCSCGSYDLLEKE